MAMRNNAQQASTDEEPFKGSARRAVDGYSNPNTVWAGDNSSDLNYTSTTALFQNGGMIREAALNNATLTLPGLTVAGSLGMNKNLVISTTGVAPAPSSAASAAAMVLHTADLDNYWTGIASQLRMRSASAF